MCLSISLAATGVCVFCTDHSGAEKDSAVTVSRGRAGEDTQSLGRCTSRDLVVLISRKGSGRTKQAVLQF